MTKETLCARLDEALSEYVNDVESIAIDPYSSRPVTEGQLVEVQRQTFYALDAMKTAILDYLA